MLNKVKDIFREKVFDIQINSALIGKIKKRMCNLGCYPTCNFINMSILVNVYKILTGL